MRIYSTGGHAGGHDSSEPQSRRLTVAPSGDKDPMPVPISLQASPALLGIAVVRSAREWACPECHKMVLYPSDDGPETSRKRPGKEISCFGKGGTKEEPSQPSAASAAVYPPKPTGAPALLPLLWIRFMRALSAS